MKRSSLTSIAVLSGLVLAVSCKEEEPPAPTPVTTVAVLIGNEGAPASGSGSLTEYEPRQKVPSHNVFQKANTYVPGNTLFSMLVEEDEIFLVINGSAEILVIDKATYKVKKRIKGLGAPRHIVKVAEGKYYISDWQEEGVIVYNANSGKLGKTILTGYGPENMLVYENFVFVVNGGDGNPDSNMTVIHALADTVMRQVWVGHNPNSLAIDNEDRLWVLSSGIVDQIPLNSTPGRLMAFDLTRDSLEFYMDSLIAVDTLTFANNQDKPTKMVINAEKNILYFLDNFRQANLWKFDTRDAFLPTSFFIPGSFNALGFDPVEEEIYLADELDEEEAGDIYRYDEAGGQLDFFKGGIKPGCFGFK